MTSPEPDVLLPALAGLDLDATLHGGQAFRWRRDGEGAAVGWIGDRYGRVEARPGGLAVWALDGPAPIAPAAADYFDAARDYAAVERRLFRDPVFRRAAAGVSGVRVLRQPPFEVLVSFLVSSNNNIVRIARSVEAIARLAGEPAETAGGTVARFPGPAALARVPAEVLRAEANLGYRDRWVRDAAARVASGEVDLAALARLDTPELVAALGRLDGVGPKVADCVALFGFGRAEVFPVDTWVRRAMAELYGTPPTTAGARAVVEEARRRFGRHAGIAQQYLFEAFRRRAGRTRG